MPTIKTNLKTILKNNKPLKAIAIIALGAFLFYPGNIVIHNRRAPLKVPYNVDNFADKFLRPLAVSERVESQAVSNMSPFTYMVHGVFRKRGYEVLEMAGEGWRNCIFKAREISTGRIVAIRIAFPLGDIPGMVRGYCRTMKNQMLFLEKNILGRKPDGVVDIYEMGIIPADEMRANLPPKRDVAYFLEILQWDYPYQIMEFIDGENLNKLSRADFFRKKNLAYLMDSFAVLALNVQKMHERGLAHGEIILKNIIMNKQWEMIICDPDVIRYIDSSARAKDFSDIRISAYMILTQASANTPHAASVLSFFEEWQPKVVAQRGLPAFAEGLRQLKDSISRTRPARPASEAASLSSI